MVPRDNAGLPARINTATTLQLSPAEFEPVDSTSRRDFTGCVSSALQHPHPQFRIYQTPIDKLEALSMAASIGKINLGLVSATNENTLALANLNFDFSIIKVVPPVEFRGVGLSLTSKRRHEAEDGPIHSVARRLAALFGKDIPEIPELTKAYGIRATEVLENSAANPKGTSQDGVFQDLVGADGTSIWAAATSGQGAIAMHLLACMLARIWDGPEATAIWTELVNTRKEILQQRLEGDTFKMDEISAARIQLTRDQLAEWDASARAWIASADLANKKRQIQLMLVLENLGLSVHTDRTVYDGVIEAWRAGLLFMENIIAGMPQTVQSAAILLAMSAWHLYPDMAVLKGKTTTILQKDPLVHPGGIVTIGLQRPSQNNDLGISWSLPLSHLHYYGKPVQATRSLNTKSSRVSMDQLLMVCFGTATRSWVTSRGDTSLCVRLMLALRSIFQERGSIPPWLQLLSNAADRYKSLAGDTKDEADRLIDFGRRRCHSALAEKASNPLPLAFGIQDPRIFLRLLKGSEAQIKFLRQQFGALSLNRADFEGALIAYKPERPEKCTELSLPQCSHVHDCHPDQFLKSYPYDNVHEWTTLFPISHGQNGDVSHHRWISRLPVQQLRSDVFDENRLRQAFRGPLNVELEQLEGGFLHVGQSIPGSAYAVATCAAHRLFELASNTADKCSLLTLQPVWAHTPMRMVDMNEATWYEYPRPSAADPKSKTGPYPFSVHLSPEPKLGHQLRNCPDGKTQPSQRSYDSIKSISSITTQNRQTHFDSPRPMLEPTESTASRTSPPKDGLVTIPLPAQFVATSCALSILAESPQPKPVTRSSSSLSWTFPPRSVNTWLFTSSREDHLADEIARISRACRAELAEVALRKSSPGSIELESISRESNRCSVGKQEKNSQQMEPERNDILPLHSADLASTIVKLVAMVPKDEKAVLKTVDSPSYSHEPAEDPPVGSKEKRPVWDCAASRAQCLNKWYLEHEHAAVETFPKRYTMALGHPDTAALYIDREFQPQESGLDALNGSPIPFVSLKDVVTALETDRLDAREVGKYLKGQSSEFWLGGFQDHLASLECLHFASTIYASLPDATVEMSVTGQTLHKFHWATKGPASLAHARSFSCIAAFESGHLDIDPHTLGEVMGMSTGNSLYIAQFLWSDPSLKLKSSVIRRSIGNVGKPGMAFFVSPLNPKIREAGFETWMSVSHHDFDGQYEENFGETSVHLSFTGYEQALATGKHGLLDSQAYFLEAVTEAYENGSWIADLDILTALNGPIGTKYIRRLPERCPLLFHSGQGVPPKHNCEDLDNISSCCKHEKLEMDDYLPLGRITSVDSWMELIDTPNNACIVRAGRNWLARLAALVLAVQKLRPIVLASKRVCWACMARMISTSNINFSTTVIIC